RKVVADRHLVEGQLRWKTLRLGDVLVRCHRRLAFPPPGGGASTRFGVHRSAWQRFCVGALTESFRGRQDRSPASAPVISASARSASASLRTSGGARRTTVSLLSVQLRIRPRCHARRTKRSHAPGSANSSPRSKPRPRAVVRPPRPTSARRRPS